MKKNKFLLFCIVLAITGSFALSSCQKMERPELTELILDPPPPPYSPLKSFWAFEGNVGDSGQFRSSATTKDVTFVEGVTGQAAQIGAGGYVLVPSINDSLKTPGSFTLAFWMKGTGPVQGGAQGLFAISNKNEFWGNFEVFLENWDNAADHNEAFLKIHTFNTSASDAKGDLFNELKIPNALGKWTHIAITYNAANSQMSVYADGQPTTGLYQKVLDGGKYGPMKFKDVNGMVIGTYQFQTSPSLTNHGPEDWARSFNGALDQFRIYNVALSPAEVTALVTSKQ
jgi:hypothetical protein